MRADLRTQSARAPLADRKDDLYETPPEATRALMAAETLPHYIWEPACGPGAIVRELRKMGHDVLATDLVDYDHSDQQQSGIDFLMETGGIGMVQCIITNPPYKLAAEFVRHALHLCPRVIMLLRLAFLESVGRSDILDTGTLVRVHLFKDRLPMMHRDGWDGPKITSGAIPFAWFVWDRNHDGPAELNRISWREFVEK